VDLVADLAAPLPLEAVCELVGVPAADRARLAALGDAVLGRDDPELGSAEGATRASVELGTYGYRLAAERAAAPGAASRGDWLALLARAGEGGAALGPVELAGLFVQIVIAGNETARTLLTGGILALAEHEDAWRALAAEPGAIPLAVEEMLRWVTPVHYFRRTATRDVTVRGRRIRAGEKVALVYASANRDEDVFAEPDRFDPRRRPNPHLAFGWGEHFCLGARLARLEARVFLEELLARVAHIEPAGPARRMRSNLNNAWKSAPVRLVAR
jgi:cytochrome P450